MLAFRMRLPLPAKPRAQQPLDRCRVNVRRNAGRTGWTRQLRGNVALAEWLLGGGR
jgi:hypothetical protein